MSSGIFDITVRNQPRKKGDKYPFVLYNHDGVCSDRLFKGNTKDNPWPLTSNPAAFLGFSDDDWACGWNRYKTQAAAEEAAAKLQAYLEKGDAKSRENKKGKQEELF